MISRTTRTFWSTYEQLGKRQQVAARRSFLLFKMDAGHNSLQFKKLGGYADYWSARVSLDLRVVGRRQGEWVWIGSHNEFDNIFGSADEPSPASFADIKATPNPHL